MRVGVCGVGEEMRTEFCLEIAEEKGGSRGDELDSPGRRGHVRPEGGN